MNSAIPVFPPIRADFFCLTNPIWDDNKDPFLKHRNQRNPHEIPIIIMKSPRLSQRTKPPFSSKGDLPIY